MSGKTRQKAKQNLLRDASRSKCGLPTERQTYTVREGVESRLEHGLTERDDHTVTNRTILAKTHSSTWSRIQGSASTVLHTPSPRSAEQRQFRLRADASHATSRRLAVGARPNLLRIPCVSDADALVVLPVMMSAAWERLFPR